MLLRRPRSPLALALFLVAAPLAASAVPSAPTAAPTSAATAAPALERALGVVRAEAIRADVFFLASDALGGRDTPSPGLRVAARFFRNRLARVGWSPGNGDSWFHTYELDHVALDAARSGLAFRRGEDELTLELPRDYLVTTARLGDRTATGAAVAVGTGAREDLEGLDLAGRWALALDADVHSSARRNSIRRSGAAGMIVVPPAGAEALRREDRLRSQALGVLRGRVSPVAAGDPPGLAVRPGTELHEVHLTARGARRLRAWCARTGDELDLATPGVELGLEVEERRRLPGEAGRVEVENVCALLPGSDPELEREVIVVSAHYDHDGTVRGVVRPGADDNASGSSGLLALAEALAAHGELRRSVLLLWVSGEEKGLFGSAAWAREPTLPEGWSAVCNINIDMIGRNAPDHLLVTPTRRHPAHNGLVELAQRLGPLEGFPELGSADAYYERSDHYNFARLGMPVAFLFNGEHADYHRPTDTPDKIDNDKIRRVVRLVARMIDALQDDRLDL